MSIVGPRPLMARYLPYYKERERKRHTVRPGLTGYAQVKGRNSLTLVLQHFIQTFIFLHVMK